LLEDRKNHLRQPAGLEWVTSPQWS